MSFRRRHPLGCQAPVLIVLLIGLYACVPTRWEKPPQTSNTQQAKSSRGNPPFYEVYGVRYVVMDSSAGYSERGVASWYGKKFHGRPTSSGVKYDMYQMTAAHKTLPLPTTVRVTNLRNNKSVIVTVNDRGPFIDNRIIDMSYAAAKELDMIGSGTTLVEVVTLDGSEEMFRPAVLTVNAIDSPELAEPVPITSTAPVQEAPPTLYLQVGAFGEATNARQMQGRLQDHGINDVLIHYEPATELTLYRVRIGPIAGVAEYDALTNRVATLQITETHLVVEPHNSELQILSEAGIGVEPDS